MAAMAETFREGQVLGGRYTLVRMLGKGGMGAVWMARQLATGRRVAVKLILPEKVKNEGALERFQREAVALGKIESPYVTQVLDAGTDDTGAAFLVMEMFDGEDVSKLIERIGPLPPPLAVKIAHQALLGLHAAHGAGAVHRDVKPANLFLAKQGNGERAVKILDFGIAKLLEEETPADEATSRQKLTATGMVFGSVPYMSPEQIAGRKDLDHRTDVWSLGASLYEMLTGQLPFPGVDVLIVIMQIGTGSPVPLLSRAPWVPVELSRVVERALSRDPAQRYATAADMARDLEPLMRAGRTILEGGIAALPPEIRALAPAGSGEPSAGPPEGVHAPLPAPVSGGLPVPVPAPPSASGASPAGFPGAAGSSGAVASPPVGPALAPPGTARPGGPGWAVLAAAGAVVVAAVVLFLVVGRYLRDGASQAESSPSPGPSGPATATSVLAGPVTGTSTSGPVGPGGGLSASTDAPSPPEPPQGPSTAAGTAGSSAPLPGAGKTAAPGSRSPDNPFGGTRKP
jgi:serine/threonine-protein kinase